MALMQFPPTAFLEQDTLQYIDYLVILMKANSTRPDKGINTAQDPRLVQSMTETCRIALSEVKERVDHISQLSSVHGPDRKTDPKYYEKLAQLRQHMDAGKADPTTARTEDYVEKLDELLDSYVTHLSQMVPGDSPEAHWERAEIGKRAEMMLQNPEQTHKSSDDALHKKQKTEGQKSAEAEGSIGGQLDGLSKQSEKFEYEVIVNPVTAGDRSCGNIT